MNIVRAGICARIDDERARQDDKFGDYGGFLADSDEARTTVLLEEVGEVAKAILDKEPLENLHAELIQVAAVCVAWLEADAA